VTQSAVIELIPCASRTKINRGLLRHGLTSVLLGARKRLTASAPSLRQPHPGSYDYQTAAGSLPVAFRFCIRVVGRTSASAADRVRQRT
jgi:hypothetical protein